MIKRSLLLALFASQAAFGQSAHPQFDRLSKLRDVLISNPQNTQVLTYDTASGKWKNADATGGGGTGTVTTFSAGNLSPLFTTSVSNATTTPALSFSLSTAGAHKFFGNNTGSTAAPDFFQPAFSDLSGTLDLGGSQASGTLAAAREPAHTGDVTNSAGSLTLALGNIPDLTTQAGSILATNIAAPTTPAAGKTKIYVDSTSKNIAAKNDAGTVNHGIQTRTATASNWIRSVADDGSSTISQPAFTDISGSATDAQIPDILTLTKASNLTGNGALFTSGSDGTLNVATNLSIGTNVTLTDNVNTTREFAAQNNSSSSSAQAAISAFSDAGGLRLHAFSSTHTAAGVVAAGDMWIDSSGGDLVIATDAPSRAIIFSTDDATTEHTRFLFGQTVASSASATLDEIKVDALTSTVTGSIGITTAKGFNKFSIYKPTYTDSSAVTITRGATLYIEDAPAVAGSLALTNPYALWIDNGISRFDGGLKFTEAAPASGKFPQSAGSAYLDSSYALPTSAGTNNYVWTSNGSDVVAAPRGRVASITSIVDQTGATEQAHITYTVPANSVSAGTIFRITASGNMDNGTTAVTFTPRVRWGGTAGVQLLAIPTVVGTTTAQTNKTWRYEATVTIRSIGATGVCVSESDLSNHTASTTGVFAEESTNPNAGFTIDTTVNKDLVFTWTLSTTTGTPHVRTHSAMIEQL